MTSSISLGVMGLSSLSVFLVSSLKGSEFFCFFSRSCLIISISILRYDFRSVSFFSGVFGIPMFSVMGELGSGVARLSLFPWDILFRPLLPFCCQ